VWNTAGVVLQFDSLVVHSLARQALLVLGVWERAARVWNTAGVVLQFDSLVVHSLARQALLVLGV